VRRRWLWPLSVTLKKEGGGGDGTDILVLHVAARLALRFSHILGFGGEVLNEELLMKGAGVD